MFNIIVDTREKTPWTLMSRQIGETKIQKLDTGDYTIEGLEDVLCIERKKSLSEFVGNMTDPRFTRELERMMTYERPYLIMEFDYHDVMQFPIGSTVPKILWNKMKVKPPFIMKFISDIQVTYNIPVILAGNTDNAQYIAINIIKRISEIYDNSDT